MDVDLGIQHPKSTPSVRTSVSPIRKRSALPQEAHGITATRTSDDPATSLEVDHMILDYMIHDAIQDCLSNKQTLDAAILRVDDFLALFNHRHPSFTPDPQLHFRQLLLQLLTLIMNRHFESSATPPLASLVALRAENASRAKTWVQSSTPPTTPYNISRFDACLPLDQHFLDANRRHALASISLSSASEFYGYPSSVSLLDLLPSFMNLSALNCTKIIAGDINNQWMSFATQWMLLACLEQYLVYGAREVECIDEAFAWGYQRGGVGNVNAMFEDPEYRKEVDGWKEWKERRLELLVTEIEGESLESRLERLAQEHPMRDFEETVKGFLHALSQSIPEPVLVQLEKGKLEGMSPKATKEFLKECGIGEGGLAAAVL